MVLRVEKTKNFLRIYDQWCVANKFPNINIHFIPDDIFVLSNNTMDLYAMLVWIPQNSTVVHVGFPVKNPDAKVENGLKILFNLASDKLKESGYTHLFTTSATPSVISSLEANRFELRDNNVNQYVKELWGQH